MKKLSIILLIICSISGSPLWGQCGDALSCLSVVDTFPYFEDFENGKGGWYHDALQANYPNPSMLPSPVPHFPGIPIPDSWTFGTPAKTRIVGAGSGDSCWVTGGLTGNYPPQEHSFVASPCFDFSNLSFPLLSLKINYDTEPNIDGAAIQVSVDSGITWDRLGSFNQGWYNRQNLFASPGRICAPANKMGWGGRSNGWRTVTHDLFPYAGLPSVKLRVVFAADFLTSFEGFAFDDITIREGLNGNYPNSLLGPDTSLCMAHQIGSLALSRSALPNLRFLWSTGDSTPLIEITTGGLYWMELSVGSQTIRDSIVITALAPPVVNLGPDTAFCFASSININVAIPTNNTTFRVYDPAQMQFVPSALTPASQFWIIATTTIEATHTTFQGCILRDTVHIEEMPLIMVDSIQVWPDFGSTDGAAKAFVSGNYGNPIFDWGAMGNGQITDSIFSLNVGNDTLTITDAIGCEGMLTYQIPSATGVFPGDTDHNQVVNMNDLLPIGIHFGNTGPVRPNATLQWIPQLAPLWGDTLANGKDLRHTDTDGNGSITLDDTLAVSLNFGITHNNQRPAAQNQGPKLYFTLPIMNLNPGDTMVIPVSIGSVDTPIVNLYGLSFSIIYDSSLVEAGSAKLDFSSSWFGVKNTTMIAMGRDDYAFERIHSGIVRFDSMQRTGYGKLLDLIVVLDDHIAKREIPFRVAFEHIYAIEIDEDPIEVGGIPAETNISTSKEEDLRNEIQVYPQPFSQSLHIQSKSISLQSISLFTPQGRLIYTSQLPHSYHHMVQLDALASGFYLLRINTSKGIVWKKVWKE